MNHDEYEDAVYQLLMAAGQLVIATDKHPELLKQRKAVRDALKLFIIKKPEKPN